MEDSIPPEPMANCGEKLSTIRIRFPDGTTKQRRFLAGHRLKVQPSYSFLLSLILTDGQLVLPFALGPDELLWCKELLTF